MSNRRTNLVASILAATELVDNPTPQLEQLRRQCQRDLRRQQIINNRKSNRRAFFDTMAELSEG